MKLPSAAVTALAIISTTEAQTIQVGCQAVDARNNNLMVQLLGNPSARAAADPDLRYGYWDAGWRKCCNDRGTCYNLYSFSYNHPYPWAHRQRHANFGGKGFDFACSKWNLGSCK